MPDQPVFTRLYLPRPLDPTTIGVVLLRLAGGDVPRPVTFELHASSDGIAPVLGCAATATQRLKRLLGAVVPGLRFGAATRPDVAAVGRVTVRPTGLPLATPDPEEQVAAIYNALAARRGSEVVSVQLILGRVHHPATLRNPAMDPLQPVPSRLLDGLRQAPSETRRRLSDQASQARFDTTLRIGVTADTVKRRRALTWEVFGTLQPLESPGVRLTLVRDTPNRWTRATPGPGWKLQLTPADLVPLLGWPLGDRDYPGVPGAHPRQLAVPEIVSRTDAVFAVGTAPGPDRPVGIDPKSRLHHLVAIGPTGSGKSTLLEHLILSDITAGRACVVIEPKSQLIQSILDRIPEKAAERIVVLDATDETAPVGFNPLDVGDRDPDIVVDGILAALAAVFEDGWGPRTEYLIQGGLLSLARAGVARGEPYTLIDLPRLLTDTAFRRPVIAAVSGDPTLAAFWAEYEDMRPGQRAAAIAAPLNKLRKLVLRKPLVRVLGQSQPRFRLRDVFREKKTVLVPLNDALLGPGAAKLLGSLIVAELYLATLERAAEKDPTKRPGMVFVDEVQNYLHLPTSIDDALAVSRSYGVAWHLAHQHRGQLPPAMRAGLDANARTKLCFALPAADARDLAKQAPQLSAEDFQGLGQYEIYAHLMAGGRPAGWCSARTLPPLETTGIAEQIRKNSRRLYGQQLTDPDPVESLASSSDPKSAGGPPRAITRPSHQKRRAS
ncbi:MAG: type IV secretory system conjugative DNA transfer family protein [Solirubrobacteraceae bacterium]